MPRPLVVGAVLYDPKVATIWDIMGEFFAQQGCPINVVFYSNYGLQVEALLNKHIDIAWNSPLAWLDAQHRSGGQCRAIAMRDTDRNRVSHLVVKQASDIVTLEHLRGKTLAVGAKDSPQATLIPLGFLQRHGLRPEIDLQVRRFDLLVGKHGDHVGGELEAFRCLERGEADASAMLDLNWDRWAGDGTISPAEYRILASTGSFDHCVFTVREDFPRDLEEEWLKALFSMRYDDPRHREMMDMEGLKQWLPGRTTGFGPLGYAVEQLGFFQGR
ncbi:MAG: phosphate/phosphite/phosphonate ABC transporter substrate-binding protein [Dehalococcoidia bacterium]|nr:phosphate/phosphite/phosphonate ABC transporter substrate-binding protein [Dehalococcoidia bacterium]